MGLAMYFTNRDLDTCGFRRYKIGTLNATALIKAEVIIDWMTLQEPNSKSCYLLCQYALRQYNSSSSNDEESEEASSNEEWVKRKKLEEEIFNRQKFSDQLKRWS